MFVSERDRLSLDLFVADVTSGAGREERSLARRRSALSTAFSTSSPAGSWDSTGRRFVVAAVLDGTSALSIVEMDGSSHRRDIT
jgi:hypothetical protein